MIEWSKHFTGPSSKSSLKSSARDQPLWGGHSLSCKVAADAALWEKCASFWACVHCGSWRVKVWWGVFNTNRTSMDWIRLSFHVSSVLVILIVFFWCCWTNMQANVPCTLERGGLIIRNAFNLAGNQFTTKSIYRNLPLSVPRLLVTHEFVIGGVSKVWNFPSRWIAQPNKCPNVWDMFFAGYFGVYPGYQVFDTKRVASGILQVCKRYSTWSYLIYVRST